MISINNFIKSLDKIIIFILILKTSFSIFLLTNIKKFTKVINNKVTINNNNYNIRKLLKARNFKKFKLSNNFLIFKALIFYYFDLKYDI